MWLLNVTLLQRYLISNVALFNFVSYSSLAINGFRKSKSLNIRNLFPSINCATLMRHFCPDGNKFSNTRIRKDSNIFVTLVLNEPLLYPLLKCLRPFRLPSLIDWLICLSGVTLNILVDISENFRRFGVAELRSLKGGILASWNPDQNFGGKIFAAKLSPTELGRGLIRKKLWAETHSRLFPVLTNRSRPRLPV